VASQAKRCGAERLSDVFSVHIAEVLLKRQAWLPYQQELDQLSRQVTTGEIFCTWTAAVPHNLAASSMLGSMLQLASVFVCSKHFWAWHARQL